MVEQQNSFQELKTMLTDYIEARIKLFKLELFEKTAKVSAALFASVLMMMLAFFLLLFLSLSAGFYIGASLGSYGTGFLIVTGVYTIIFGVVVLVKKNTLEKYIVNRVISELTRKEGEDSNGH